MDAKKRLSSQCKCGPRSTAVHEMGECPKVHEENAALRSSAHGAGYCPRCSRNENRLVYHEEGE